MESPILTWIIFLPLIGAGVLVVSPGDRVGWLKSVAFVFTLVTFIISVPLFFGFEAGRAEPQFVQKIPWIESFGVHYHVGVDGISLFLVLLTTFLMPVVILASWTDIKVRMKEYMISMLLLETGMVGVFAALDMFLFYVFWEAMLIPMYLIIGIWGGPRRVYAAIKFFLYTIFGSLLMLVAILVLYFKAGGDTFEIFRLYDASLSRELQRWLFLAFFLSFAIKVPMFPFHTWLPDAHVEAPTAGSVILAGVLLKMGTYGFIRFAMPLFPDAVQDFTPLVCYLAIISIIYGALVSMVQNDVKKLVAYSSVSHLGFVMLGLFVLNTRGVEGGIIQMVNHGLSTGALFLMVGMLYERRHTREISDFGGLTSQIPVFSAFFMIVVLSSLGLPGLNGFVGEFLVLVGTFQFNKAYAVLAAVGVILTAAYLLWMFKRVMLGQLDKPENMALQDLNRREVVLLLPVLALIFWIGIYPSPFLRRMDASVNYYIEMIQAPRGQPVAADSLGKGEILAEESDHRRVGE